MSQTNIDDGTDGFDAGESAVLNEARKRERAAIKRAEAAEAKLQKFEDQVSTARSESATELMNTLGYPGLTDDVLEWVEGDVTLKSVTAALKQRGISVQGEGSSAEGSDDGDGGAAQGGSPSDVGQRLADAAAGQDSKDLDTALAGAESQEDVRRIMAEHGLERSHS